MSERRKPYPFDQIEPKWQAIWEEPAFSRPNPGEKISIRPSRSSTSSTCSPTRAARDCTSAIPRVTPPPISWRDTNALRGFNVLHPMGWDAFGLPAEQYAIKTGQHPRNHDRGQHREVQTQMKPLGFSYDWSREVNTTDPDYFKWTQWIFLKLYNSWFNPETTGRAETRSPDLSQGDDTRTASGSPTLPKRR